MHVSWLVKTNDGLQSASYTSGKNDLWSQRFDVDKRTGAVPAASKSRTSNPRHSREHHRQHLPALKPGEHREACSRWSRAGTRASEPTRRPTRAIGEESPRRSSAGWSLAMRPDLRGRRLRLQPDEKSHLLSRAATDKQVFRQPPNGFWANL